MLERPYVVYADFEATNYKYKDTEAILKESASRRLTRHVPNSVCLYIVCTYDSSKNELWSYVGKDCVVKMIHKLNAVSKKVIREMRFFFKKIHMTEEDTLNFSNATKCYLCKTSLYNDDGEFKGVRDHDHKTGDYRGAACAKCNINYYTNRYLPVFFHNLSNYDSHFIIQKAYEISDELMEMKPMKYKKKR